ncbi:SCO family protein [Pseudomonadota bacterium]
MLVLALTLTCAAPIASHAQDSSQAASIGGRFMLQDHNGQVVTDKNYQGRFMLITFGYTFCPDVCPTNLANMSYALHQLADKADRIVPIFVTVDPARDDAVRLRDYVPNFNERLVGLTGPQPMIDSIVQRYKIVADIHRPEGWDDDEYVVDHTASIFLMSPDGDFLVKFAHGMPPADMAKRIGDFLE